MSEKIEKSEQQWRQELDAEEYQVLREKGTEAPFTGCYWNDKRDGAYKCSACGEFLFDSATKYDSGSGWPSFYQPLEEGRIVLKKDDSLGITRTEVVCAKCDGHLGHVFEDGPPPTGLRYCINSAALTHEDDA